MIPFRVFGFMEREMVALEAEERLSRAISLAHGAAIALRGDAPAVQSETRALQRQADRSFILAIPPDDEPSR